jgi:hypothetical protein
LNDVERRVVVSNGECGVFKRAALNGGEELIEFLGGSQKNALSEDAKFVIVTHVFAKRTLHALNHTDARFCECHKS